MLINPFVGLTAVGAATASYFFEERFEGVGYQNTWDETGTTGTCDEDYATSPLEGSQSLHLVATNQHPITKAALPSDQSELWVFFRLRIDTALTTARRVFALIDTAAAEKYGVTVGTDNTLAPFNGNAGTATVDALVTGSDYNVWAHFLKGTGSNGGASVGFSTTGTEPVAGNAFSSRTNGSGQTDMRTVAFWLTNVALGSTTGTVTVDKLLISTTGTIGDSPA